MKILKKIYHIYQKIKMKHHYQKQLSELEIVEAIITEDIINGNTGRKQELNERQANIKSTEKFLKALKKLK